MRLEDDDLFVVVGNAMVCRRRTAAAARTLRSCATRWRPLRPCCTRPQSRCSQSPTRTGFSTGSFSRLLANAVRRRRPVRCGEQRHDLAAVGAGLLPGPGHCAASSRAGGCSARAVPDHSQDAASHRLVPVSHFLGDGLTARL